VLLAAVVVAVTPAVLAAEATPAIPAPTSAPAAAVSVAARAVAASAPAAPGDPAAAVALAATATGQGLWVADADGSVAAGGDATALGAPPGLPGPAVGMAPTATGKGWWLATAGGAVVAQGDAASLGPAQPLDLDGPLVGMAATPSHRGYWLVASDGGVFAYGDARFFGSAGGTRLNQPIVGMAATPDGNGYWLVASDGGVFTYGDARFFGSVGGNRLAGPIVDIAGSRDGGGYWVLGVDGTVSAWGDAPAMPRLGPPPHPVFNVASTLLAVHDDGRPTPARGGAPAHPGRDLPTVVLYPAALDGVPLPGPWPLVAFAHGFNTTPDDYLPLLRSWAAAGYVVAAPFLPGERGDLPGPDRADIPEEPADLSAALSAVLSQAAPSPLAGLADAARVAVAGHSDGGMAVAGMTLGSLPHDPRVRAALVLSGDTFGTAPGGNVPVLVVEGTADPINPAAVDRLWSVAGAPKAAVRILGGVHLAPFITAGPQQDAVRAATVDFLDAELSGARDGLSRLAHDADVPGLTSLSAALR